MMSVLLINFLLKMVVVEQGREVEGNSFFYPLYLLSAAVTEHLLFVGAVFVMLRSVGCQRHWRRLMCAPCPSPLSPCSSSSPSSSSSSSAAEPNVNTSYNLVITKHFYRKIYLALTFPELAKLVTLLLQTWDSSPVLFLVAGGLCLAFQYTSLCAAVSYFQQQRGATGCSLAFVVAVLVKVAVRMFFHSPLELVMLGIIG